MLADKTVFSSQRMTKPGLDLPATSAPLLRLFNHSTMAPLYDELVRQLSLLVARGFKYIVLSTRRFSATVYPNFIFVVFILVFKQILSK